MGHTCRYPKRPIGFEVHTLRPDSSIQDRRERTKVFHKNLKALEESLNKEGVVVIDTDSGDPHILRMLNGVIDVSVVPLELSPLSLNPTLDTLDIINPEYVMLVHHRYDEIDTEDEELLVKIAGNQGLLCSNFLDTNQRARR